MRPSKHDAVRQWLLECPSLPKLGFLFGRAEAGGAVIVPRDTLVSSYIDGSEERRYAFDLAIYCDASYLFGDGNISQQELVDGVAEWVSQQVVDGNLPQFPDGCEVNDARVLETEAPYIAAQDENVAKYIVPFAIDYYQEARKWQKPN